MHPELKAIDDQISQLRDHESDLHDQRHLLYSKRNKLAVDLIIESGFLQDTTWWLELYLSTHPCVHLTLYRFEENGERGRSSDGLEEIMNTHDDSGNADEYIDDGIHIRYGSSAATLYFNGYPSMVKFVKKHRMKIAKGSLGGLKRAMVAAQELIDCQESK